MPTSFIEFTPIPALKAERFLYLNTKQLLKDSGAAGPSSNIGLEERGEFIGAGWEFLCAVANLIEFQVDDGIDQLAHYNPSIAAGRQSKRGNNGDALGRLYQRDLCVHEIDHDTALPSDTCFRQMLIDELLVRIASSQ